MHKSIKFLGLLFFLLFLLFPNSTYAAAFNNSSNELPTFSVTNVTRNPNSTTAWSSSVSADAGDVIGMRVYYHNTSQTESANRTKIFFNVPSNTATSFTASGSVSADNATQVTSSATINLSSSQTLTFIPGSFYWYPDQDTPLNSPITTPPGTQREADLFTSTGMILGNIPAESTSRPYQFQGTVHVHFRVGGSGSASNLPSVTTNSASGVSGNGATLNGNMSANNNSNVSVFFEYSTNSNLSNPIRTNSQNFNSSSATFSAFVSGLSQNVTYFYRAIAQGNNGQQVFGNTQSFVAGSGSGDFFSLPFISTNPISKVPNSNTVLLNGFLSSAGGNNANATVRFEWGTNVSLGNSTPNQFIASGAFNAPLSNLSANTVYYFRAVAQNSFGTSQGNILSFITEETSQTNFVTTNPATGVGRTSATLNGFFSLPGNSTAVTSWFEWGSTGSLGNRTPDTSLGAVSSADFSATITGLNSGSNYFYRAVAQNARGEITRGATLSLTTLASAPSQTVVKEEPAGVRSLFIMSYGTDKDSVAKGEVVNYRIGWRNESNFSLANSLLKITLPAGLSFAEGDARLEKNGNILLLSVGTIPAGGSGSISFKATVSQDLPAAVSNLTISASMFFDDPLLKRQADVTIVGITKVSDQKVEATVTPTPEKATFNVRRAAVAGVSAFFPNTAIGWLALILLVILVSAIIRALV